MANSTNTSDGAVQEVADGYELRFERVYDSAIEDVWELLTDSDGG